MVVGIEIEQPVNRLMFTFNTMLYIPGWKLSNFADFEKIIWRWK